MKSYFLAYVLVLISAFVSCTKNTNEKLKSSFEISARATLETAMTKEDFLDLNWNCASIKKENGFELMIEIPSRKYKNKKLVYAKDGQQEAYNFYELKLSPVHPSLSFDTLVISGVDHKILHEYLIHNNKVVNPKAISLNAVQSFSEKRNYDLDVSLPEVIVFASAKNDLGIYSNYLSMYWLFNGWSNYVSKYADTNTDVVLDANAVIGGKVYLYDATITILSNGKKQVSFNFKDAFLLSGLAVTFNLDPLTNKLEETSVITSPEGGGRLGSSVSVFVGTWTQVRIADIIYSNSKIIEFTVVCKNAVSPLDGSNISARYSLAVQFDASANKVAVHWN